MNPTPSKYVLNDLFFMLSQLPILLAHTVMSIDVQQWAAGHTQVHVTYHVAIGLAWLHGCTEIVNAVT